MTDNSSAPLPPDDLSRHLTVARPDRDDRLPHFTVVGDTYTIVVSGTDTAGQYTLIDMLIPPGGGPGPHRHDFEEMFTMLEGEIELTFRGETSTARAGETVNIPANAPHHFRNMSDRPARMLCVCAPAGQDAYFREIGVPVPTRTTLAPKPTGEQWTAFVQKAVALAPKYRSELLPPE